MNTRIHNYAFVNGDTLLVWIDYVNNGILYNVVEEWYVGRNATQGIIENVQAIRNSEHSELEAETQFNQDDRAVEQFFYTRLSELIGEDPTEKEQKAHIEANPVEYESFDETHKRLRTAIKHIKVDIAQQKGGDEAKLVLMQQAKENLISAIGKYVAITVLDQSIQDIEKDFAT